MKKAFIPNGGRLPLPYIKTERECYAVRIVKQRDFAAFPTRKIGMCGERERRNRYVVLVDNVRV